MIQRIQTLYLLISTIAVSISLYFFKLYVLESFTEKLLEDNMSIFVLAQSIYAIIGLIIFGSIFMFKNRDLQIKISKFGILINLLLFGLPLYLLLMLPGEDSFSENGILVFVSNFIALLLLFFAVRAIRKDENLVKSVDRLR